MDMGTPDHEYSQDDHLLDDLFLEPPIEPVDLYLSPVRSPYDQKPPRHWLLILAPPGGIKCTFLHIVRDEIQVQDQFDSGSGPTHRYRRGPCRRNVPLHSTVPISNGYAMRYKIGTVTSCDYDDVIRVAETALEHVANETQSWTRTFLEIMEGNGFVEKGECEAYHQFFEPVSIGDLGALMQRIDLDEAVEQSIEDGMRGMALGDDEEQVKLDDID